MSHIPPGFGAGLSKSSEQEALERQLLDLCKRKAEEIKLEEQRPLREALTAALDKIVGLEGVLQILREAREKRVVEDPMSGATFITFELTKIQLMEMDRRILKTLETLS